MGKTMKFIRQRDKRGKYLVGLLAVMNKYLRKKYDYSPRIFLMVSSPADGMMEVHDNYRPDEIEELNEALRTVIEGSDRRAKAQEKLISEKSDDEVIIDTRGRAIH